MENLAPFRLRPWFSPRIWGKWNLEPWYNHQPIGEPVGEAWLSGDDCIVETGPLAGQKFSTVFAEHREALLGRGSEHAERFPLLMKVLFPQDKLSVQVHPDDAMARQYGEPHGKTECWYALEAEPGASVALGMQPGTTEAQIRAAIEDRTLENLLRWVPVQKGDMIFVDAGTVHAIGPGVTLLETQQNSDMTYRLYDYGRPRELHLEHGMQAVRIETRAGKVEPRRNGNRTQLIQSNYFIVDHYVLDKPLAGELGSSQAVKTSPRESLSELDSGTVQLIFAAIGNGELSSDTEPPISLRKGELVIIPACVQQWYLTPHEPMEILRVLPR